MPTYRYSNLIISSALTLASFITSAIPAWGQTRGMNYIYGIQGNVAFGRYLIVPDRAFAGAVLSTSHRIRVEGSSSQVILVCSNNTTHRLNVGTHRVSDYCPPPTSQRPGPRNSPRDPFDPTLPYVIGARNTALLDTENLSINWNPVVGASQYYVTITGEGVDWSAQTEQSQVAYAGSEKFQSDYRYSVNIFADSMSTEQGISVGFTVLPSEEVEIVTDEVRSIEALQLDPDTEAIALALFYSAYKHSDPERRSYALNQSAIDVLQERIDTGTDNSQIYLLQADTYLTVGLPLLAKEKYLKALSLAESNNLSEQQALSSVGLGIIEEGQTNYSDAISYFQTAIQIYETLGDTEQVETLADRLNRIQEEIKPSTY